MNKRSSDWLKKRLIDKNASVKRKLQSRKDRRKMLVLISSLTESSIKSLRPTKSLLNSTER